MVSNSHANGASFDALVYNNQLRNNRAIAPETAFRISSGTPLRSVRVVFPFLIYVCYKETQ